jgi:choline dehydrogenase-like flavoprotein
MTDFDAVIVGSGAAGGLVAYRLATAGKRVALIERGGFYNTSDFTRWELQAYRNLWWEPRWTSNTEYDQDMPEVSLGMGRCVGGSTTIFTAVAHRPPRDNIDEWWSATMPINALGEPLTIKDLEPHFVRVERETHVRRYTEWDAGTRKIAGGFRKIGLDSEAVNAYIDPTCDQSGCLFGCPTGAKRGSLLSYVLPAIYAGAEIYHNTTVTEVLIRKAVDGLLEAYGVRYIDEQGRGGELTSKTIVLAAGALETPQILLRSGLPEKAGYTSSSMQIGRNLAANTGTIVFGVFDDVLKNWLIHPISAEVSEFAVKRKGGFLLQFSESMEGPLGFSEVVTDQDDVPLIGTKLANLLMNYKKVAGIFITIHDGNNGTIILKGREPIFYKPVTMEDRSTISKARGFARQALEAAGAKETYYSILLSHHSQGTCRMGEDTSKTVVNSEFESHDVKNLFICDGSVIPTVLDVNPSLTIYALADMASDYILRGVLANGDPKK